jgi:hypothetical protein
MSNQDPENLGKQLTGKPKGFETNSIEIQESLQVSRFNWRFFWIELLLLKYTRTKTVRTNILIFESRRINQSGNDYRSTNKILED